MNKEEWDNLPDFNKYFHTDPIDMIDLLLPEVSEDELREEIHRESLELD